LGGEPALAGPKDGWWDQFVEMLTGGSRTMLRPAGAVALLAIGFFAAKIMPNLPLGPFGSGAAEAGMARVREVRPDADGRVRIVVDEVRQKTISGGLESREIQELLMQAVSDPSDPGLRAQSVDLLNTQRARSSEVRDMLILALSDQSDGVRLEAMEGLKSFAQDHEVQAAVSQALLSDSNPGIRMQAIDLLTEGTGENLNRQVIGTLQQLMEREENAGLRQRCQRVLASFNATPGIY
jgi:HEAT repeat protein